MTVSTKTFNSEGGFGVKQTTIITDEFNIRNVNSFELKNVDYSDIKKTDVILKGTNTAILSSKSNSNTYLILPNNTINFITANIVGVGPLLVGVYSVKIETTVQCSTTGDVSTLSTQRSVNRDDVPAGQSWSIVNYDSGNINQFSFSATASGATGVVKWICYAQVISVSV